MRVCISIKNETKEGCNNAQDSTNNKQAEFITVHLLTQIMKKMQELKSKIHIFDYSQNNEAG